MIVSMICFILSLRYQVTAQAAYIHLHYVIFTLYLLLLRNSVGKATNRKIIDEGRVAFFSQVFFFFFWLKKSKECLTLFYTHYISKHIYPTPYYIQQ